MRSAPVGDERRHLRGPVEVDDAGGSLPTAGVRRPEQRRRPRRRRPTRRWISRRPGQVTSKVARSALLSLSQTVRGLSSNAKAPATAGSPASTELARERGNPEAVVGQQCRAGHAGSRDHRAGEAPRGGGGQLEGAVEPPGVLTRPGLRLLALRARDRRRRRRGAGGPTASRGGRRGDEAAGRSEVRLVATAGRVTSETRTCS